jgi:arylsulfatase A-like enzyme
MQVDDGIVHPEMRFPKEAIPFASRSDLTHTAFVADRTMAYLERRSHTREPFFCIAGFYSPHSPWVAPREFIDRYDPSSLALPSFPPEVDARRSAGHFDDNELRAARQGYYAMVSEVDHHVGHILATLEELGQSKNTIVIYTSDHGEWLGEHLRYGKGHPGHDCITSVPMIVRWPAGVAAPGRTSHAVIEAVDLVPTLLECAGIPVSSGLQGRSFWHLLERRAGKARTSALTEGQGWKTLRTEHSRYVVHADGSEALYDLRQDPLAYCDVSEDPAYAPTLAEVRHELLRRLIDQERPRPRVWAY